jgi:hypothetical protein
MIIAAVGQLVADCIDEFAQQCIASLSITGRWLYEHYTRIIGFKNRPQVSIRDFPFQFAVRLFLSVIAPGANDMSMSFGCQAISAPRRPTRASLYEAAATKYVQNLRRTTTRIEPMDWGGSRV